MNAYNLSNRISPEALKVNASRHAPGWDSRLNEAHLAFLNPASCQYVNPYSKTFWQDMKAWLSPISSQAETHPKASDYRCALEPYLLRRVHMTAETWSIQEVCQGRGQLRLLLQDVRLSHVHDGFIGAAPGAVIDHMNVWVSTAWLNRVIPDPCAPLAVDGILYEYISKQTRNIAVLPVLLAPISRKVGTFRGTCAPAEFWDERRSA